MTASHIEIILRKKSQEPVKMNWQTSLPESDRNEVERQLLQHEWAAMDINYDGVKVYLDLPSQPGSSRSTGVGKRKGEIEGELRRAFTVAEFPTQINEPTIQAVRHIETEPGDGELDEDRVMRKKQGIIYKDSRGSLFVPKIKKKETKLMMMPSTEKKVGTFLKKVVEKGKEELQNEIYKDAVQRKILMSHEGQQSPEDIQLQTYAVKYIGETRDGSFGMLSRKELMMGKEFTLIEPSTVNKDQSNFQDQDSSFITNRHHTIGESRLQVAAAPLQIKVSPTLLSSQHQVHEQAIMHLGDVGALLSTRRTRRDSIDSHHSHHSARSHLSKKPTMVVDKNGIKGTLLAPQTVLTPDQDSKTHGTTTEESVVSKAEQFAKSRLYIKEQQKQGRRGAALLPLNLKASHEQPKHRDSLVVPDSPTLSFKPARASARNQNLELDIKKHERRHSQQIYSPKQLHVPASPLPSDKPARALARNQTENDIIAFLPAPLIRKPTTVSSDDKNISIKNLKDSKVQPKKHQEKEADIILKAPPIVIFDEDDENLSGDDENSNGPDFSEDKGSENDDDRRGKNNQIEIKIEQTSDVTSHGEQVGNKVKVDGKAMTQVEYQQHADRVKIDILTLDSSNQNNQNSSSPKMNQKELMEPKFSQAKEFKISEFTSKRQPPRMEKPHQEKGLLPASLATMTNTVSKQQIASPRISVDFKKSMNQVVSASKNPTAGNTPIKLGISSPSQKQGSQDMRKKQSGRIASGGSLKISKLQSQGHVQHHSHSNKDLDLILTGQSAEQQQLKTAQVFGSDVLKNKMQMLRAVNDAYQEINRDHQLLPPPKAMSNPFRMTKSRSYSSTDFAIHSKLPPKGLRTFRPPKEVSLLPQLTQKQLMRFEKNQIAKIKNEQDKNMYAPSYGLTGKRFVTARQFQDRKHKLGEMKQQSPSKASPKSKEKRKKKKSPQIEVKSSKEKREKMSRVQSCHNEDEADNRLYFDVVDTSDKGVGISQAEISHPGSIFLHKSNPMSALETPCLSSARSERSPGNPADPTNKPMAINITPADNETLGSDLKRIQILSKIRQFDEQNNKEVIRNVVYGELESRNLSNNKVMSLKNLVSTNKFSDLVVGFGHGQELSHQSLKYFNTKIPSPRNNNQSQHLNVQIQTNDAPGVTKMSSQGIQTDRGENTNKDLEAVNEEDELQLAGSKSVGQLLQRQGTMPSNLLKHPNVKRVIQDIVSPSSFKADPDAEAVDPAGTAQSYQYHASKAYFGNKEKTYVSKKMFGKRVKPFVSINMLHSKYCMTQKEGLALDQDAKKRLWKNEEVRKQRNMSILKDGKDELFLKYMEYRSVKQPDNKESQDFEELRFS